MKERAAQAVGALEGITVLEIGARIGTAVAGSLLAQLGATVVFVETSDSGHFAEPKWHSRDQFVAGKLSLRVSILSADDRTLLMRLAQSSDVILRSSDADSLAFGGQPLEQMPANCVSCDLTAFGSSGPMRGVPATDSEIQAMTGIMDSTGIAGEPPRPLPLPLVEQLAGVYAAAGVLAGLRARRKKSDTPPIEIALYDVAFSAMTSFLAPALSEAASVKNSRMGNRHTMAAPWNVYPARDGWLLLCAGNDEQWERICSLIGKPSEAVAERLARNADRVLNANEVDAMVEAWTSLHSIDECVLKLSAQGIPCGPVAAMDGFPREANLNHRGMVLRKENVDGSSPIALPGSPFCMSGSPGRPLLRVPGPDQDRQAIIDLVDKQASAPQAVRQVRNSSVKHASEETLPLAGLRVIEIGHYTTAPVAARFLAGLGAEVIKVEPVEGEAVRRWPPSRNGQGIFFTFQNADKRSLALDMNSEEGGTTLRKLIASADVLVENLRPGALERKGFGPKDMLALNPRLVYCGISGFGADAIYQGRPAFDTVIQAMSGLMAINRVGDMPLKTGPSMADVIGAAFGLAAILAALEYRETSRVGQFVDLSMQDVCAWATQPAWNGAPSLMGGAKVIERDGGYVLVGEGKAAVRILSIHEVVQSEQTLARGLWALTPSGNTESYVIASPIRIGNGTMPVPRPGPALGRDNHSILEELA